MGGRVASPEEVCSWMRMRYERYTVAALNYNYHREHHSEPGISWYYLPKKAQDDIASISYFKQYFRQWKPPYLLEEPCPPSVRDYDSK